MKFIDVINVFVVSSIKMFVISVISFGCILIFGNKFIFNVFYVLSIIRNLFFMVS